MQKHLPRNPKKIKPTNPKLLPPNPKTFTKKSKKKSLKNQINLTKKSTSPSISPPPPKLEWLWSWISENIYSVWSTCLEGGGYN